MTFLAIAVVLLFDSLVSAECYYPGGLQAPSLIPYNTGAAVTHCCRDGDLPLSNGLCFSPGLNYALRRGCTDKNWNTTLCPDYCTADPWRNTDAVMTPCGGYGTFCCGQDDAARSCCDSGNGTFQVSAAEPQDNNATQIIISTTTVSVISTATGSAIPLTTTSPSTCPTSDASVERLKADLKSKRDIVIALAVVFAVTLAALIAMSISWFWGNKKNSNDLIELARIRENVPPTILQDALK